MSASYFCVLFCLVWPLPCHLNYVHRDGREPRPLLFLDRAQFAAAFAADVPEKLAAFIADSQVGFGVDALNGAVSEPAWRTKPSWYLVTTHDRMIRPASQRAMSERAKAAVTEAPGNHAIFVSQPTVVAQLIKQAANATS